MSIRERMQVWNMIISSSITHSVSTWQKTCGVTSVCCATWRNCSLSVCSKWCLLLLPSSLPFLDSCLALVQMKRLSRCTLLPLCCHHSSPQRCRWICGHTFKRCRCDVVCSEAAGDVHSFSVSFSPLSLPWTSTQSVQHFDTSVY